MRHKEKQRERESLLSERKRIKENEDPVRILCNNDESIRLRRPGEIINFVLVSDEDETVASLFLAPQEIYMLDKP